MLLMVKLDVALSESSLDMRQVSASSLSYVSNFEARTGRVSGTVTDSVTYQCGIKSIDPMFPFRQAGTHSPTHLR